MKRKSLLLVTAVVILATVMNMFAGITVSAADAIPDGAIEIGSKADFEAFTAAMNAGTTSGDYPYNSNSYFVLTNDIDFSEDLPEGEVYSLTPIGTNDKKFTGTFDGNGHTLSNFEITTVTDYCSGLFACTKDVTIKNLTIDNAKIEASAYTVAAMIGKALLTTDISNCTITDTVKIKNTRTSSESHNTGAFVAVSENGGSGTKKITIENCTNNADVTTTATGAGKIGGFIGYSAVEVAVSNCINNGDISVGATGQTYAGGLVGKCIAANIVYCINNGDVATTKALQSWSVIGGIVGNVESGTMTIQYCINNGDVTNAFNKESESGYAIPAGGIVGSQSAGTLTINNCYNFGTVATTHNYTSVVAAQILGRSKTTFSGSGNYALDNGTPAFGGAGESITDKTGSTLADEATLKNNLVYKNINAEVTEHLTGITTNYYGYQATTVQTEGDYKDTFSVRLVATLSGDYTTLKNVGFMVSATYKDASGTPVEKIPNAGTDNEGIVRMNTIYESITSTTLGVENTTTTHTAESLGGDYIFVLVCPNIPADANEITFTITPFYTDANSNVIYSATEIITVTSPADLPVAN